MELFLTPLTFIIGIFLTISYTLLFVRRIVLNTRKFHIEESPTHVIWKRRILICSFILSLIGLMTYFSLGLTLEQPVLYRSIYLNKTHLFLAYVDTFNTNLLKSIVFFSVSMIISLLYKHSNTRSKSVMIYSIIRLMISPLVLINLHKYRYFSFFLTDLIELSESCLLILIFISLLKKVSRQKSSDNLFQQYESVFIYKRSKSSCFLFMIGLVFEIVYYSFLVILSVTNFKIRNVMDFLMIIRSIYITILIYGVLNIIYSKEQPIHDTLVSMYKMRLEMEDNKEETKRVKKNDFYKLTL